VAEQLSIPRPPLPGLETDMLRVSMLVTSLVCVLHLFPAAVLAAEKKTLTVWLLPTQRADYRDSEKLDVGSFNQELARVRVEVINTTDAALVDQLRDPHPDYWVPNWPLIKGHKPTLLQLGVFAQANDVDVRVLFVTWSQAFRALRSFGDDPSEGKLDRADTLYPPDVAHIGSTWVEYFSEHGVLLKPTSLDGLHWRPSTALGGPASLRYCTDGRLLYYWKKRPSDKTEFKPRTDSWESLTQSLQERLVELNAPNSVYGVAFPIGRGTNLLHNYSMLANTAEARFFKGDRVDLTSRAALQVPLLLGHAATYKHAPPGSAQPVKYRVFSFPQVDAELANDRFIEGRYLAIIEPVGFLSKWHERFQGAEFQKKNNYPDFWEHAGVAVLPQTFVGGSDLMVLKRTSEPVLAFELAKALASDCGFTNILAKEGHLPPHADQCKHGPAAAALHEPDPYGLDQYIARTSPPGNRSGSVDPATTRPGVEPRAMEFKPAVLAILKNRDSLEYPASARFPDVEAADSLDAFQRLWRRISEAGGDERNDERADDRIILAAKEVEWTINRQIYTPTRIWAWLTSYGWIIIPAVMVGLLAVIWLLVRSRRVHRRLMLALKMYLAKLHSQVHGYGCRVIELAKNNVADREQKLHQYGKHIAVVFSDYLRERAVEVDLEIQGYDIDVDARMITEQAYQGAIIEYQAAEAEPPATLPLILDPALATWRLRKLPHVLVAILAEWFFNYLKNVPDVAAEAHQAQASVVPGSFLRRPRLRIVTSVPLSRIHMKKLSRRETREEEKKKLRAARRERKDAGTTSANSAHELQGAGPRQAINPPAPRGGHGLPLIRELLWYGFKTEATCYLNASRETVLEIPIPLKWRTSNGRVDSRR
jgi:hypothetical protein